MRYVSLFSGIEAVTVATEPLGWEPVAFAEIEPFPCAVLAHRWPDVPNLGDVTKIDWKEFADEHGAVDVVAGGSPCQSFSVAGGRESLDGESRLMFEYIRAVRELRPRFFLWENVPGCLSTRDNAFGQLLGEMADLGYGLAWRVLDAQFFGVAQRRRRVFLVWHIGGGGSAAAVLFESESVSGNTKPSREKREELARAAGLGDSSSGFKHSAAATAGGVGFVSEQAPTLVAGKEPSVLTYALQSDGSTSLNSNGNGYQTDGSAYTLNCIDRQSVVCMGDASSNAAVDVDKCGTLHVGGSGPLVVKTGGCVEPARYVARRLTQTECERLQGFPDGHTDIPYKGKEHPPDAPRYKALGNSMAVPVIRWICERIDQVDKVVKP